MVLVAAIQKTWTTTGSALLIYNTKISRRQVREISPLFRLNKYFDAVPFSDPNYRSTKKAYQQNHPVSSAQRFQKMKDHPKIMKILLRKSKTLIHMMTLTIMERMNQNNRKKQMVRLC